MKEHAPPAIPVCHLALHEMVMKEASVVRVFRIWRDTEEDSQELVESLLALQDVRVHHVSRCFALKFLVI